MQKLLSLSTIVCLISICGCAKTEQATSKADTKPIPQKADILLNDDGNVTDRDLEQAQHIDIKVKGNGRVVITGVKSKSGKVEDHELSEKDSKELLMEIVKASRGGDKRKLSSLVQNHVVKLQEL